MYMYTGHGGYKQEVAVAGQGGVYFGEVFVGVTGKTTFVVHLVRLITGIKCADSNVNCKTIFNFMYDMCRTQTKDAQSFVKDRSFDWAVELEKKDLQKRVCQIFAAQIGVRADGNNSLVQRMSQFMKDNGIKSMPLRNLKVFNTDKIRQQVEGFIKAINCFSFLLISFHPFAGGHQMAHGKCCL